MDIAICATNPAKTYSGGRYHALMLAEALVVAKYNLTYVTNQLPVFFSEFASFRDHANIKCHLTTDFLSFPQAKFDVVFIVPGSPIRDFYHRTVAFAKSCNAHIVLLNFESGNWFNELSPSAKPLSHWDGWNYVASNATLILSSSREGSRFAEHFYATPHQTIFRYCYPAINTPVADSVTAKRQCNRVLFFCRVRDSAHKGSNALRALLGPHMAGTTIVIVVGAGRLPLLFELRVRALAKCYGISIEVRLGLSEREKYKEYKMASVLAFPSYFEGFGYPPVEALYCGAAVVAFELPVLKETCGDKITYARHGDVRHFASLVSKQLDGSTMLMPEEFEQQVRVESMADRVNQCMMQIHTRKPAYLK